ncbi:class I SAM-dependent methyltransferase [Nocardioides anomalus]|uniref:Class I SAM-dependent methyltransferase n=1 Tax=Nocardioides anomalus TaxID=2712223 RepID=A0A6G6WHI8_9ACTN|nr:class I SAM-dependent methyltransferase [Nocardioides anomalus]QIG44801.1 class I SAM-dependent methyltransferase [Nocardioides anomalus]
MKPTANERAFAGHDGSAARWFATQPGWWHDHFESAADQALSELHGSGVATAGRELLDVGCGDGIITLGLVRRGDFARVVGMDIVPTDQAFLEAQARHHGVRPVETTDSLSFVQSAPDTAPFPDGSFDLATAWSVFEHVTEPRPLLRDVHRVLRPGGVLFIQVWPLWYSEHGSHLWPFFDETFVHLTRSPAEILDHLRERIGDRQLAQSMYDLYESCNRHTVDDIQSALLDSGFGIGKVSLSGASVHVPPGLERIPLSRLAIDGCTILAVRR